MTHLQEDLEQLRESFSDMADLIKSQLRKAFTSLMEADEDLANEVIFNERRVNAFELKIDKECEHIFALLNPVAQDMRLVFSTLKMNADLERIGDYAEGIAKLVLLGKKGFDPELIKTVQLKPMYETAYRMLEDAVKAYCDNDSKLARSVFARDLELNEINYRASSLIIDYCKRNIERMEPAIHTLSIIRKLERVGDHITNIAEEIIFYREAKVLKHGNKGGDHAHD